jgi:predicted KAP-like P-loop ATPase
MVNRVYDRDQPVDGSQEKPDQLNRQDFAKHLAEIIHIKPDEDCLTVSVEGEWGSGKSSVLAMVKRHLKAQENPPIIIEFNPWLIGDVDSLVQKFLVQFSAQLDIPDRPKETLRVAQELLSYSKLFDVVKLIPGAEPWASVFKSVISGVGSATGKIGKLKELDIHGRKIKVKNAVERLGVSIVVIIDDIDRLTPAEAFEVIKLSKAVADFKGVTFVLAFDQEYLAAALESNNIHNSNQFIEKIVQLRIPLPLVSIYDMHDLSNKYMDDLSENNLLEKYSDDERRLSEVYFKSARYLIRTPRDLKRIMNHLRFVLIQTAGEVCFTDLYLLSVLAIVCPDIYQSIKDNPWAYIGMGFDDQLRYEKSEDIVKKEKEYVEGKISNQPEKNRKLIRNILNDLFPLVYEDKFSSYSSDFDKSGRVASIKRLSVALHYQVPGNMTSDNETVMFINGEIDRIKHIESVIDRGSSDRFFEILSNQIDMVTKNAKDLLPVLFENIINSNKVKDNEKNYGGFLMLDHTGDCYGFHLIYLRTIKIHTT